MTNKMDETEKLVGVTLAKKPKIRSARIFGIAIILIFFGGFGLWAYLAPLESAALAPGKITVSGNRRIIQHLEGGIVEKLYVKEGSKVNKGQVLIKLDDTRAKVSLEVTRNEVYEMSAIESRLLAEIYDKENITFSPVLIQNKDSFKAKQVMNNQEAIFIANKKTFEGNINILKQRIDQLKQQIDGTKAQLISTKKQLALIMSELKDVEILYKKKLVERTRLLSLQREEASLIGQRGEAEAKIANLKQKIGETKIQIITLTDTRRKDLLSELRETQQKLAEAKERVKAAQDMLDRTDIRAPLPGTVVDLQVHTIGGVIKPGEDIMDIVPKDDKLVIEANVDPLDIDVVHPGLMAKITMTALKTRTTPTLNGTVTHVSADAFQDEKTGKSYFKARVEIGAGEIKKLAGQRLYPGMPVEVMIITNKLTPWEYFSSPIKRSFDRAFREQ